jgi:hypothetical protein
MTTATLAPTWTIPERVLLGAYDLYQSGRTTFTAADLVVAAWQRSPPQLGLEGYAERFPAESKIMACVMKQYGLLKHGLLVRVRPKVYALTRDGEVLCQGLLPVQEPPAHIPVGKLPIALERELARLLDAAADVSQRNGTLTLPDACRFWNVPTNLRGCGQLPRRVEETGRMIADLTASVNGSPVVLRTGRHVDAADLVSLRRTHEGLQQRFQRHINLVEHRLAGRE